MALRKTLIARISGKGYDLFCPADEKTWVGYIDGRDIPRYCDVRRCPQCPYGGESICVIPHTVDLLKLKKGESTTI